LALASTHLQDQSKARAFGWLKKTDSDASNEWLVVRLLLADRFGDAEARKALLDALLKEQNSDGGWCWLKRQKSDALATGQTLYALGQAGLPGDHPALERARTFLIETQEQDGSWLVPSTKNGKIADTSTYWGTCWAVIGLCETLPK
jgi:hypothetical protein